MFTGTQGGAVPLSPTQEKVRFGLFELDLKAAQLTRNGSNLRLPQQPLRLLSVLVESPGEIITREQLRQRLWPSDVFIDFDHGLNKSMQKLRDALGDSAVSPRYIETIPRVGYRFIAPVTNATRPAELTVDSEKALAPPAVSTAIPSPADASANPRSRWLLPVVGALAVSAVAVAAFYISSGSIRPSSQSTPS